MNFTEKYILYYYSYEFGSSVALQELHFDSFLKLAETLRQWEKSKSFVFSKIERITTEDVTEKVKKYL